MCRAGNHSSFYQWLTFIYTDFWTAQKESFHFLYIFITFRAIPEKNTWEGKTAGNIFFYGWLVRKVFKLYGSLVFDQI